MHPVICMVTDRRRFGAGWDGALIERTAAAAGAGVHLIQIREPDLDARTLTRLVEHAVRAVRGTRARILVNDRADIALAARAHGVHLRAESAPAARVRALAPRPFLIGRSVHSRLDVEQAAASGGLDYLLFGTVFETASKPGAAAAGVDALAAAAAATSLPVLAIGGIGVACLGEIARAGAAGFAAIGLFADCSLDAVQVIVRQSSLAFDTT